MNFLPSDIGSTSLDFGRQLNQEGYVQVPHVLESKQCEELRALYDTDELYRKKVVMERYRFGSGEYQYFSYPLPDLVQELRQSLFTKLSPIANQWMEQLGIDPNYPSELPQFLQDCHQAGQERPTPLILKYEQGGFNTLHQDLYGSVFFPIQAVILLSDPQTEFEGGEFVLTRQIPRAQSEAVVLNPAMGDMVLFTTNFYPVRGSRGYYRVNVRHGVSKVKSGRRYAMGIIFHDAAS